MYPWLVFLHVIAIFGFLLAHGASASVSFRLRSERNLDRLRALIELSAGSYGVMYASLGLLLLTGIIAAFMGNWWGRGWIWLSLGLLVAIMVAMTALGSRYYTQVRKAVGVEYMEGMKMQPPLDPASPEVIDALLARGRPMLIAVIGFGGIAVIAWLMMFKPF